MISEGNIIKTLRIVKMMKNILPNLRLADISRNSKLNFLTKKR
jgi:hypothetical protein